MTGPRSPLRFCSPDMRSHAGSGDSEEDDAAGWELVPRAQHAQHAQHSSSMVSALFREAYAGGCAPPALAPPPPAAGDAVRRALRRLFRAETAFELHPRVLRFAVDDGRRAAATAQPLRMHPRSAGDAAAHAPSSQSVRHHTDEGLVAASAAAREAAPRRSVAWAEAVSTIEGGHRSAAALEAAGAHTRHAVATEQSMPGNELRRMRFALLPF